MSRSITQTSSSSSAVAAGSSVIVPVNTTTGFNAGDYVYTLPTGGVGTRATGNVSIGSDTPYVGTTWVSTALQSVNFRTASYGPLIDQATFTGTTRTFGQTLIAANTVKASYGYHVRNCTLANGNVFLMYNISSTLYFKIIDSTGATVVAETTITTILQTSTVSGNFACCTLASGNIQIAFTSNGAQYQIYSAQYSPTGSVVVAPNDQGAGIANPGNFSMAALSGGGSVLLGSNGLGSIIYNPYYHIYNSDGALIDYGTSSYGVGGSGQYYVQVAGMPASYGTNIWVFYSQGCLSSGSSYPGVLGVYSGGSAVTSANGVNNGATNGDTFNMTIATDGTICCAAWTGNIQLQRFTYTRSTATSGSLTVGSSAFLANGYSASLQASADGAIVCISHTGTSAQVTKMTSTNARTGPTTFLSGVVFSAGVGNPGCFQGTSFGSGVVSAFYLATSTNFVSQGGGCSIAATNGVTVLTGTSYTPTQGYYLMGVAATDAAANATGQVIMNGTAQLGSTYPTVTSPIYYSYQTTASQPLFGQRGSVNATTVTLRGLEA
jgi:hypothetical protein